MVAMTCGIAFQRLGAVIDELEEKEMTVLDVVTERSSLVENQQLSVEITVGLDCLSGLSAAEDVSIVPCGDDGSDELVTTTFTVSVPTEEGTPSDATDIGGHQQPTVGRASEESAAVSDRNAPDDAEERDIGSVPLSGSKTEDVPYYKNYDLLARVYEEHDTFAEMTAALDVDVTPATVREHMVNHGIHPTPSDDDDTGADREDDSDVETNRDDIQSLPIEADGYGLPESVTVDSLVRAVQKSRTLYEVQTALELDRSTTRDILSDLDLLDLVISRVSADHSTELEDVVDRIHTASTT